MSIQQHPDYHQGFYDAQDSMPIWPAECTREYAAGWLAFWDCATHSNEQKALCPGGLPCDVSQGCPYDRLQCREALRPASEQSAPKSYGRAHDRACAWVTGGKCDCGADEAQFVGTFGQQVQDETGS